MKKTISFILLAVLVISCATETARTSRDEIYKLTKQANDESLKGHLEKNADKITAVYHPDAIVLPPGGVAPLIGIDSIKTYYARSVQGSGKTLDITTENIRYDVSDENNAVELGKYVIRYQSSDTSTVTEFKGEMLIVWKKIEGKWKIYLDMWH